MTLRDTVDRDSFYDLTLTRQLIDHLFRGEEYDAAAKTFVGNPHGFKTLLSCLRIIAG